MTTKKRRPVTSGAATTVGQTTLTVPDERDLEPHQWCLVCEWYDRCICSRDRPAVLVGRPA